MSKLDKLSTLANYAGYSDVQDLLEENVIDSVVPGICKNPDCDYTTEVEPDSDSGWCEECGEGSVVSCLVLAGII